MQKDIIASKNQNKIKKTGENSPYKSFLGQMSRMKSAPLHLVTPGANQAFFEKCERLTERFEVDALRVCATGVALGFLRAVRCCGAVAATACASSFLVVLPKRYCFPAPLLPALGLPEYGRSLTANPSASHVRH